MNYDFKLAKLIIDTHVGLGIVVSASLGMREDWFWTAESVWENGEYTKDLDTVTEIAGITSSYWATPIIKIETDKGDTIAFNCHNGISTADELTKIEQSAMWSSGCLSGPCQNYIDTFEIKNFQKDTN